MRQAGRSKSGQGRLIQAVAAGGHIRVVAAVTTAVVEEARRRHQMWPTAAAALGRTMTAAALLAAGLKANERLMIQVIGDGPIRQLLAQADWDLHVRGYAGDPAVHLPLNGRGKLDVSGAVGKGQLYVTRDMGLKEPYRGAVPLVSGEIAQDVAYYLARSEQTPSSVALGVLVAPDGHVQAAGGWMIAPLPGAFEDVLDEVERRVRQAPPVTELVAQVPEGASPLVLVGTILEGLGPVVLDDRTVEFRCPCSRRRFESGLVALGVDELTRLADESNPIEVTCRFCGKRYYFSDDRLRQLARRAAVPIKPIIKET